MSLGHNKSNSKARIENDPQNEAGSVCGSSPTPGTHLLEHLRAGIKCAEQCLQLLTLDEAARALRIDANDIRVLITTKQLVSVIIAGRELIPVQELVELIADYAAVAKRSFR